MNNDELESRLRSLRESLPDPDEASVRAARESMRRAVNDASPSAPRSRPQRRHPRRRTMLLAVTGTLAVGTGAVAGGVWELHDLPGFGADSESAFVLPTIDILPGGYPRERPPAYAQLPPRPAIVFPTGVDYEEALAQYATARRHGEVLPAGAELAAPLPTGTAVAVRDDGRVALDPAAPMGYSLDTGLVQVMTTPGHVGVRIARCQVQLGSRDRGSPACRPGPDGPYVRSGLGGRWIASPPEDAATTDGLVSASTAVGLIDRPSGAAEHLPAAAVRLLTDIGGVDIDIASARLAFTSGPLRVFVAPAGTRRLCVVQVQGLAVQGTCAPRRSLATAGAITLGRTTSAGGALLTAVVGDGITSATPPGGEPVAVVSNAFSVVLASRADRVRLAGPSGVFDVSLAPPAPLPPPPSAVPPQLSIPLDGGGHASVVIDERGDDTECWWVAVRGTVRSAGCRPLGAAMPYDVVTGGFLNSGQDGPSVYHGRFAPEVGRVLLNFRDGSSRAMPLRGGHVLYELTAATTARRGAAVSVTTIDRHGVPLVRNRLTLIP